MAVILFDLYICCAIAIDLFIGDPRWIPHPVRLIGFLLVSLEKKTRKIFLPKTAGTITVCLALAIVCSTFLLLVSIAASFSSLLQILVAVLIVYVFVAIRDLLRHSDIVYTSLLKDTDIRRSRDAIAQIVGRDTDNLDRQGIARACIETVAENMVDGITAPLFWAIVFSLAAPENAIHGITLAALGITTYKTINTMDSMFGYKNEQYQDFGWAPARLDDIVNIVPARLSGLLISIAAFILGYDGANSYRIYRRDRLCHSSPNAGHPESAIAGALNITLGGPSSYFGTIVDKPTIGDGVEEISPEHIKKTHFIIVVASALFLLLLLLCRHICIWIFTLP